MLQTMEKIFPHKKTYLIFLGFVVFGILIGCGRSDSSLVPNSSLPAYSGQPAISSATSETANEPVPTETPSAEINWDEPARSQSGPHSAYWALRDAFPLPDFQEITITKELGQTLEKFFRENPGIIEQVEASREWLGIGVFLVDVTGDLQPEILIHRFTNYGASDQTGGLVSVYDLATAQHLGDLWTNDLRCENMGWYERLDKDGTSFLIMDFIFFRTYDGPAFNPQLNHVSYILWEINCDGLQVNASPLWLFMNTTRFESTGRESTECSLIDPSYELAAGFSKDPYSWYETVKSMASEGCDPIIRDMIAQLRPVETIYKRCGFVDDEGLHLRHEDGSFSLLWSRDR